MFFAPVLHRRTFSPSLRSYDRSFERFLSDSFFNDAWTGLKLDKTEQGWTLTLDLPGVAKEELNIAIEGAVVRIETKADAKRSVKAAYELSDEIDSAASTAKLENGVLTLSLARKAPVSNARQLDIQ